MLRDSSERYGLISRGLHWGMTLLFAWHFFGVACRVVLGSKAPLSAFMFSTHRAMGTLLLLLIVLRLLWFFLQRRHRPAYANNPLGRWARFGHGLMYLLMLVVPVLALMRQYGSGRAFAPWGIPLMAESERIPWMIAPASAVHGLLGWLLFVLILGHIAMALIHHFRMKDDTLRRMWGKSAAA